MSYLDKLCKSKFVLFIEKMLLDSNKVLRGRQRDPAVFGRMTSDLKTLEVKASFSSKNAMTLA